MSTFAKQYPARLIASLFVISCLLFGYGFERYAKAFQADTVTLVSAASYETNLAPDSVAAAFGTNISSTTALGRDTDPNTAGIQLPTTLGGVTVEIGGIKAGLFGVFPGQINLHIPANVPVGNQAVVVKNGNITVNGTVQIVNVAPGLFTFNANGLGVLAGNAVRIRNSAASFDEIATFNGSSFVTRAIDLGPSTDEVYLSIYGTGWRRATNGTVKVALAGVEYSPQYAGAQGSFVGLDQINILIPRALLGVGKINVTVNATGAPVSNTVEAEIAGASGTVNPTVTNPASPVIAAQTTTITGTNFASTPANNLVRIGGVEAQVISGNSTSLNVRVPYGAETGQVTVRTTAGEGRSSGAMQVRSSISGVVETTDRQPLTNVKVKALIGLTLLNSTSGSGGAFVLSELPGSGTAAFVTVEGSSVNTTPAYGSLTLNQSYQTLRDNQFASPIALQQVTGTSGQVGGGGSFTGSEESDEPVSMSVDVFASPKELSRDAWPGEWQNSLQPVPDDQIIRTGEVTLTLPGNLDITFPDGSKRGLITLTQVESSRTPVSLPGGIFSSAIVQITPFGTSFGTGGTLRFPNTEKYPAGTQVRVYRLNQRAGSSTLGRFIQAGFARVSSDGLTILTDPGVVIEATYYLVGLPRTLTNVVGRVLDADRTPLRRALVRLRGQEAFTDGNGGFTLRNVPIANASDLIIVEASYARANGRVDRASSARTTPVVNGFTSVGDILMPAANANQPPVLIVSPTLSANAAQTNDFNFIAYDADEARIPTVSVTGARFASVVAPTATSLGILRLAPTANEIGTFTLVLAATDSQNVVTSKTITVRVAAANRAPVANAQRVITDEDTSIQFTLSGSDPDGDQLKYLLVTRPSNGVLTGIFPAITFTPGPNFNGNDSFTFRVSDGLLDSPPATVSLVVNPVNDAPVLTVPIAQTVAAGQPLTFTVSATDVDAGQTITYSATNLPSGASFNPTTRQFSWTPSANQAGNYTVNFTAIDNGSPAKSDVKSVAIVVSGGVVGWQQTSGPAGGSIRAMAVSGTALLAATLEGYIYRSTDNGISWKEVVNSNLLQPFLEMKASGAKVYALSATKVYVSNDNGATWTNTNATYPSGVVTTLAVNGNNAFIGLVTSALNTSGVYRSTDGGTTWAFAHTGITQPVINALAVSGTNLIAGAGNGSVFRSTNNGSNWAAVNLPTQLLTADVAVASGTNFFIGGGGTILRSTDNGATFVAYGSIDADFTRMFLDQTNLYVGTLNSGIFRINSAGAATQLGVAGLPTVDISDVAVINQVIVASTLVAGVYRSTDNGQNWVDANTGIIGTIVTSMTAGNGFVFAGLITNSDAGLASIARTNDNGKTWEVAQLATIEAQVSAMAYGNNVFYVGTIGDGLYRSTNDGVQLVQTGLATGILDVRAILANGATVYVGTRDSIYRSTDSGVNWTRVYIAETPVISLSLVGNTVYAGVARASGGQLYRSTDGTNWTAVNLTQAVTSVVQIGSTLIAGVIPNQNSPVGVYVSTDNGATWTAAGNGLTTPFTFKLLTSGNLVYAATGSGVFVSGNAGQTWVPFNEGLRILFTPSLILNGSVMLAGTGGGGVWARQLIAQ